MDLHSLKLGKVSNLCLEGIEMRCMFISKSYKEKSKFYKDFKVSQTTSDNFIVALAIFILLFILSTLDPGLTTAGICYN